MKIAEMEKERAKDRIVTQAMFETAKKELQDKQVVKQTHPAHFETMQFLTEPSDINAPTATSYAWQLMAERHKAAGTPVSQRVPLDFS